VGVDYHFNDLKIGQKSHQQVPVVRKCFFLCCKQCSDQCPAVEPNQGVEFVGKRENRMEVAVEMNSGDIYESVDLIGFSF
jgi:hypothetical protein